MRTDAQRIGRIARGVAVLSAVLLLLAPAVSLADDEPSLLDQTGIDALAEASRQAGGFDARSVTEKLMAGTLLPNADAIVRCLLRWSRSVRSGLLDALSALAAPVLVSLASRALLGDGADRGGAIRLLCRAGCASLLMGRFLEAKHLCASALDATLRLTDAAAPVLASALTLTGLDRRASILTPQAALCADLIGRLLRDMALPLCAVTAVVAACANLSECFQINRLFALSRDAILWGIRLLISGFVGLMALQGLLTGDADALTVRALRRAIQSAMPIIGGEVSDSTGALLASAVAVRGFAGVAGMLALIGASLGPILRLAAGAFSLRLASAVLEPVADRGVTRIVGHYADLSRMLLAICTGGTLLAVLTLGATLALCAL